MGQIRDGIIQNKEEKALFSTQLIVGASAETDLEIRADKRTRVTFVGYKDFTREGLSLSLGQNLRFDQKLSDTTTELAEVTVTQRRDPAWTLSAGRVPARPKGRGSRSPA